MRHRFVNCYQISHLFVSNLISKSLKSGRTNLIVIQLRICPQNHCMSPFPTLFRRLLCALFLTLFLSPALLHAQEPLPLQRHFRLHYSNDFFTATDYYYTQGVRMELALPAFRFLRKTHLFPGLKNGTNELYALSFNHQCFTPTSIREDIILVNDRPFAGAISLAAQRIVTDTSKNIRITSELQAGGIGACSGCAETQTTIHRWLDGVTPHGWQHQVNNTPLLNYTLTLEKGLLQRERISVHTAFTGQAGSLYTNAQAALTFRAGRMNPLFNPWQKNKPFRIWITGTGSAIAVGYNATLQGGLFGKESVYTIPADEIKRIVWRADYGLELAWRGLHVHYLFVDISPEFDTGMRHRWGHCKIGVAF